VGERAVAHGGPGIEKLCDWLIARTGATPEVSGVAIEMTQGPVVEALLERGFCVYGVNPKQLDRFRDRFTVAGAKDASLTERARCYPCPGGHCTTRVFRGVIAPLFSLDHWWEVRGESNANLIFGGATFGAR